jgi:hypothetical protein
MVFLWPPRLLLAGIVVVVASFGVVTIQARESQVFCDNGWRWWRWQPELTLSFFFVVFPSPPIFLARSPPLYIPITQVELNVLKSSNARAAEQFMASFVTYTDNQAFLTAAGPSEWCVGFSTYTTNVEFETKSVSVAADDPPTPNTPRFTMVQNPLAMTSSAGLANKITRAIQQTNPLAVLFVNNDTTNPIVVETTYTVPVASWRAVFSSVGLQDPAEGVKFSITLQTSNVVMAITGIADGFFGFTISSDAKVSKITFEGAVNVAGSGEAFELDNICASATHKPPPTPAPVPPTGQPPSGPSPTPDDDDDEECFAADWPLIGFLICLLWDILQSLGGSLV